MNDVINGGSDMIFTIITEQEKLLPFYITGIGIQAYQEPISRPDGFPVYQWTYCSKGEGIFKIGGKEHRICEGTGFFFSPNIPHEYHAIVEPWETYWITFDGIYLPTLFRLLSMSTWEIFKPKDLTFILELFHEIENDLLQDKLEKVVDTSAKLYTILISFKNSQRVNTELSMSSKLSKLKPVIHYMETHYDHYITLEEMANLIQVTTHHLCKLFKSTFGISPFHYLIRLRLQIAKQLLLQSPHLKVKEIAQKVCYSDTSYFCSIFKKQETVTPQEFRKLHGVTVGTTYSNKLVN